MKIIVKESIIESKEDENDPKGFDNRKKMKIILKDSTIERR